MIIKSYHLKNPSTLSIITSIALGFNVHHYYIYLYSTIKAAEKKLEKIL